MNDLSKALGLIEVIGYPTAIAAADAASKASNVTVSAISKVGSGIMTVQLIGDVAAIRSAVEAGAVAAKEIGTLRTTHVIPRYDSQLENTLVKNKETQTTTTHSPHITADELRTKTNAELKTMIHALEIDKDEQFLKTARKDELITAIMTNTEPKEADNGIDG